MTSESSTYTRTGVRATLIGFTAKTDKSYFGKTQDGKTYLIIHVCVYGKKNTPAWWFEVSLWDSLAEMVNKLSVDRCLVKVEGNCWQVEYTRENDIQRQTRLRADTFAYKPHGSDWIEVKPQAEPAKASSLV
jgi:single-stranded DNA-binding protein